MQADKKWFGTDDEFGQEFDAGLRGRAKELEEIEITVKELIEGGVG